MKKQDQYSKWLKSQFGGNSENEAIKNIVDKLISESKQNELPTKLSEIASIIGINPKPIYKKQNAPGELIIVDDNFRISLKMSSGKPPSIYWYGYPRLRFSYAHELIHCLHYDFSSKPPKRIAPKPSSVRKEEEMCNYGASLLILPYKLVQQYISTQNSNNFFNIASNLAKKAHASLHASLLFLINNNGLFEKPVNKLYILSSKNEGYMKRGENKPRCILSAIYLNDFGVNDFLPAYKGIEAIGSYWSLLKLYANLSYYSNYIVKNEIIDIKGERYVLNGEHKKIENSNYIWSDLHIERFI